MNDLISQMRIAALKANSTEVPTQTTEQASFTSLLSDAINDVNQFQMESGQLSKAFDMGDPNVNISDVMIASEKSGIAFQAMVEVRNKIINAYQEIMNMPV